MLTAAGSLILALLALAAAGLALGRRVPDHPGSHARIGIDEGVSAIAVSVLTGPARGQRVVEHTWPPWPSAANPRRSSCR